MPSVAGIVLDYTILVDSVSDIPATGLVPGQLYATAAGAVYVATSSTTVDHLDAGGGSVTSVNASGPSGIATWSGGPVTTTGTLTQALSTQSANTALMGPTSGSAATPAFRATTDADSAEALWLPTTPTTPYAWWKADAGVYNDAGTTLATATQTVQQWNDQSGNNRHLGQATSGKRPTYQTAVKNGLPVVRFDSTDDCMTLANLAVTSFTVGCLFQPKSGTAGIVFEQSALTDSNNGFFLFTSTPTIGVRKGGTRTSRAWLSNWGTSNYAYWTPTVMQYDNSGTWAGFNLNVFGVWQYLLAGTFVAADPGIASVTDTFNVGSRNNGASVPAGIDLGELVIYTPALSYRNAEMLSRYLARRWDAAGS